MWWWWWYWGRLELRHFNRVLEGCCGSEAEGDKLAAGLRVRVMYDLAVVVVLVVVVVVLVVVVAVAVVLVLLVVPLVGIIEVGFRLNCRNALDIDSGVAGGRIDTQKLLPDLDDVYVYGLMGGGDCCHFCNKQVLDEMKGQGVVPNHQTLYIMMEACGKRGDYRVAERVLEFARAHHIEVDQR